MPRAQSNIPTEMWIRDLENFLIQAGIAESEEDAWNKAQICLFSPDGNEFSVQVDGKGFGRVVDAFGADFQTIIEGVTWFVWTLPGLGEVHMTCTGDTYEQVVVKNKPC